MPTPVARQSRRPPGVLLVLLVGVLLTTPVWLRAGAQDTGPQEIRLTYPVDLVVDGDDLLVADFKSHGLFRVSLDGRVTELVRGEGLPRTPLYGTRAVLASPDGDGWLVADPATFALYRVSDDGDLSTLTTELDIPQGLAPYDETSVLVSDLRSGIGAVMRVSLAGVVTVFAEIPSPKGIIADGEDGFVVVSHGERALYRLSRDGTFAKLASGEPFDFPHDVARLEDGRFAVTDGYASAVFVVDGGGAVTALARGTPLVNPQGIVLHADGNLYVTDPQAGAVFRVAPDGTVSTVVEAVSAGAPGPGDSLSDAVRRALRQGPGSCCPSSARSGRPARSHAVVQ